MPVPTLPRYCLRPALAAALLALLLAGPAFAQWTPVAQVPPTPLYSLASFGDTLVAGADTCVHVSTDGGTTWHHSTKPVASVVAITALDWRDGRLYAGTYGQGVFVSADLGATWSAFNQGLVGGFADSQLDVVGLQARGDSLVAATAGAGVYVRGLSPGGAWAPFGDVFEPNQASNVNSLALGGTRLVACAGANGQMFVRDPGDAEWEISNLDNQGLHAGLTADNAIWMNSGWMVGTNLGVFSSATGIEPWTRHDPGLGPLDWCAFATRGLHVYAAFDIASGAVVEASDDLGASWQDAEGFAFTFIHDLAVSGAWLYAGRGDGLWRRPLDPALGVGADAAAGTRFAMAGAQPAHGQARVRFELAAAGPAAIDVFDLAGRRVDRFEQWWPAGAHEATLDLRSLAPGVFVLRLDAAGRHAALRLVHVR